MFRVTLNSLCRNPSVNPGRAFNKERQVDKLHELITRLALGFDPNRPPEYVTLYNSAMNHYDEKNFESARDNLREALKIAKEQNASETTIGLYKKELEPIENFLQEVQKTKESVKRYAWWKAFSFGGISTLTTGYTFWRLSSQGATRATKNPF